MLAVAIPIFALPLFISFLNNLVACPLRQTIGVLVDGCETGGGGLLTSH